MSKYYHTELPFWRSEDRSCSWSVHCCSQLLCSLSNRGWIKLSQVDLIMQVGYWGRWLGKTTSDLIWQHFSTYVSRLTFAIKADLHIHNSTGVQNWAEPVTSEIPFQRYSMVYLWTKLPDQGHQDRLSLWLVVVWKPFTRSLVINDFNYHHLYMILNLDFCSGSYLMVRL